MDDKNRYAIAVGHVALEWNLLEHDLQRLGARYLTVDDDVTAHIFAFLGNASRIDFIRYLVDKFEDNQLAREHIAHFLDIYNRLRANRNVVEHGMPAITPSGVYLDRIIKIGRRGEEMPFAAPLSALDDLLKDLATTRGYAHAIEECADNGNFDGLEKPSMPARLKNLAHSHDGH